MFKFNKDLELPPQLKWKFSHEPELLGWTIRARNYNTFVANCMLLFMAVLNVGAAFIMYSVYAGMSQPWRTLSCVFFYMLMLFVTLSMTHQRMKFAYRFTRSGIECCEWKDFPEWALTFLKWLAGITAIFFVFMATIDPSFLLGALIGPGGIGLTYLSMAYSKSYREMHTQYHHLIYEWKDFTQLAIATNREVLDLKFSHFDQRLGRVVNWSLNIFCKRKQKEKVAEFIRPFLSPGVPFIKAKVNVPLSTD
ncbi:hypothetical protein K3F43_03735 [Pseudomonas tussilaginis]|uniref:hypothetical protein n=1 Tax=unclassified Pseudomonas TaxID=196821 RepID=UPI001C73CB54|nr:MULTISPECIES: hypothetical protein [unclassified Pseudomonas]QYX48627.1 hypothetical protein K3F43_03735 [Pseudomonas sp. S11A 273]